MSKKLLPIVVLTLFVAPQLLSAAVNETQLASKEIKASINSSLAQAQQEVSKKNQLLLRAVRKNIPFEVKALLAAGADINTKEEGTDKTPLYIASENGFEGIVDILLSHTTEKDVNKRPVIDAKIATGHTPLIIASGKGYTDIVKKLVDKKASLSAQTKDYKFTALHFAIWAGKVPTAVYLIENSPKKSLEIRDLFNDTPLLLACDPSRDPIDPDMVEGRLANADRTKIIQALLDRDVNINAYDGVNTPLILLLQANKNALALKMIHKPSIDVNAKDNGGNTAMHYAKSKIIIDALRLKGAQIDPKNNHNTTPLLYAASRGDLFIVKYLKSLGADIKATDKSGENALFYAIHSDNCDPKLIQYLVDNGVDTNARNNKGRTLRQLLSGDYDENVYCDSSIINIIYPNK